MHNFDIIQSYDQKSLLHLMTQCGLPSLPARYQGVLDSARRSFSCPTRDVTYDVFLDSETLKIVGRILCAPAPVKFLVEWNNTSAISPLGKDNDDLVLAFDVNVHRSIPFGTFKVIMHRFERALRELDKEFSSTL